MNIKKLTDREREIMVFRCLATLRDEKATLLIKNKAEKTIDDIYEHYKNKNSNQQIHQLIENQPEVNEEFVEKWAVHMSINALYDAEDQKQKKIDIPKHPKVENQIIKMLTEAGVKIKGELL